MPQDVSKLVLDAFHVEHKEQLEQIRTLVGSWSSGSPLANEESVREAFRLAHSLKGGARVCGLREAERLGHGLESVLEKLHHGELTFDDGTSRTVTVLLDSIEDWMAALEDDLPPPDVADALQSVTELLKAADAPTTAPPRSAAADQLLPVFLEEHDQHTARLRSLLAEWQQSDEPPTAEQLREAERVAHTLAGAAAVVEIRTIESLAAQLEQQFRAARTESHSIDDDARQTIDDILDRLDQAALNSGRGPADAPSGAGSPGNSLTSAAHPSSQSDTSPAAEPAAGAESPSPSAGATETVRVTLDSLDRLMRSSSDLIADNQQVGRFARQMALLQGEMDELERERDSIRRAALPKLHQLAELQEFARVAKYLDLVDRQLGGVARRMRQLSAEYRQVMWQLQVRSLQIQRDVHEARLVPAHSIFQGFRKMVRDLAAAEDKQVEFQAAGMDVCADRMVLQELKDPVMHILRNCVSHGIERADRRQAAGKPALGRISIHLEVDNGRLNIVVEDDGRGIDIRELQSKAIRQGLLTEAVAAEQSEHEALSLVFAAGFTTAESVTELAGRGMGLSVVHEAVSRLQGSVDISLRREGGVRVDISVPVFISTHRILLVACGGQTIAIPTHAIERLLRVAANSVESIEGQPVVTYERRPVRLVRLDGLLGSRDAPPDRSAAEKTPLVLLKSGTRLLAVSVDAFIEERDALMLNLDEFAECDRFAGGIALEDGRVALLVRPQFLVESLQRNCAIEPSAPPTESTPAGPGKVLIVDDSFTTRTLEKNILEAQGYEVKVATDGVEAMSLLRQQRFGLVITDVEMPRMDGFALLEQMKADRRLASTPVILVTSRDRQEDQQHGLDLGADAYIVKRKFDHQELISTIRQLI